MKQVKATLTISRPGESREIPLDPRGVLIGRRLQANAHLLPSLGKRLAILQPLDLFDVVGQQQAESGDVARPGLRVHALDPRGQIMTVHRGFTWQRCAQTRVWIRNRLRPTKRSLAASGRVKASTHRRLKDECSAVVAPHGPRIRLGNGTCHLFPSLFLSRTCKQDARTHADCPHCNVAHVSRRGESAVSRCRRRYCESQTRLGHLCGRRVDASGRAAIISDGDQDLQKGTGSEPRRSRNRNENLAGSVSVFFSQGGLK